MIASSSAKHKQCCVKGSEEFFTVLFSLLNKYCFYMLDFWRLLYCKLFGDMVLFHTGIAECTSRGLVLFSSINM